MNMLIVFWLSVLGIVLLLAVSRWRALRRLRNVVAPRQGKGNTGRAAFFTYLEGHGVPVEQSETVYRHFQDWVPGIKGFPVELDDQLGRVFGICGSDVDGTARDIAALCRRSVPPEADFSGCQTVQDLLDIVLVPRKADRPWWLGEGEDVE
jgi:hypothetical protein